MTYFACAKLGVVCVPMNLGWRADEIAYVLDHSESRGIVVEAQLVPAVLPGVEKVPAVQDVIVAYGTDGRYEQTLPDRAWLTFADLHEARGRRARAPRRRAGSDQLPLHERDDLVPQGRGRQPSGDLPRVADGRGRDRAATPASGSPA